MHTTVTPLRNNSCTIDQNTVIQLRYFNYKYETNNDINGSVHNT